MYFQDGINVYFLFFSGEFDRVHYPLPLLFENPQNPNLASWKRTINKLRKQVRIGREGMGVLDSQNLNVGEIATSLDEKEKYVCI